MKKLPHTGFPGSKVYFTEADVSSQQFYRIGWYELSVGLKLWLLIADRVILSTGHMLRSPLTFQWLEHEKTAISNLACDGVIIPSLSDQYSCCRDFADDQVADVPASAEGEAFNLRASDRGRLLDDIFPMAITWSSVGESQWFQKTVYSHLSDRFSPLRQRLVGISNQSLAALTEEIGRSGDFRRGTLSRLAHLHCPSRVPTILRYGDCFYYLSGAATKDAWPLLHSDAAALLRDQVSYEAGLAQVAGKSEHVWREILEQWSLSSRGLASLPLTEVVNLRKTVAGKKARRTIAKLLNQARQNSAFPDTAVVAEAAMRFFLDMLATEVGAQKKAHARWDVAETVMAVGGWVTSGIGTACGYTSPDASLALGVLGSLVGAPLMRAAERTIGGTELVLLAEKVGRRVQTSTSHVLW